MMIIIIIYIYICICMNGTTPNVYIALFSGTCNTLEHFWWSHPTKKMSPWSARWRNKEVTAAPVGNVLCCDFYSFCLHWSVYSISALSQLQCRTEYVRATRKKKNAAVVHWSTSLLSNRHDWCILWAYSLLRLSDWFVFSLDVPFLCFSLGN